MVSDEGRMTDTQKVKKPRKRYATVKNPTIEAVAGELFRFTTREQALERLETIRSHFVLSKNQSENNPESLLLWVRGYALTDKEKKDGYSGNYAMVTVKDADKGKLTLGMSKVEAELKYHPQRKRPKHRHPNWGHPILRSVKKKKIYSTLQHVEAEFQQLHEEYPEVSIPSQNKLYIMIYGKAPEGGGSPVQKYILEIKTADDGGYYIEAEENTYQPNSALPGQDKKEAGGEEEASEPQGYFTSMVALKRNRKKPPPAAAGDADKKDE